MEVSGVIFRPLPCFSGAGIDAHSQQYSSPKLSFTGVSLDAGARFSGELRFLGARGSRLSVKPRKFFGYSGSGFCDDGHVQYYNGLTSTRCGGGKKEKQKEKEKEKEKEKDTTAKKMKKRLKLLKGLSRDLSTFSEMDFGLYPDHGLANQVKGKMISEATELLLGQLQQLRAEEKELKLKRREEKAKLKAARMQNMLDCEVSSSSSSSSESSDSECGEVVDMSRIKREALAQPITPIELQPVIQEATLLTLSSRLTQVVGNTAELQQVTQQAMSTLPNPSTMVQGGNMTHQEKGGFGFCTPQISEQKCCTGNCASFGNVDCRDENNLVTRVTSRKIEVCMGGKCKNSGAASLLEEFQRVVGAEGSVAGCKCLGKCRDGPNVRVLNCVQTEGIDDSARTSTSPVCIGVGLEDVGLIVANFFGGNQKDLSLAAAL